ncbi:hypothetical protein C1645_839974 [Glomus cerebriforme]|uniref:Uncharacterized protein n=1 Tax=Glomus cerebriforme TaxID=658196 RepID=A0A397RZV3_9GLOM|nr:hypothetical protein C1645_839974 [Glomus cerebriforme]
MSHWYLEVKKILTNNNHDNKLVGIYSDLGTFKKESIEREIRNNNNSKENWDKLENEFTTEEIEEMKLINSTMLEINEIWGNYKIISKCIKDEFIDKYYNNGEQENEKIDIELEEAKEVYKIMEKMVQVKNKITK